MAQNALTVRGVGRMAGKPEAAQGLDGGSVVLALPGLGGGCHDSPQHPNA